MDGAPLAGGLPYGRWACVLVIPIYLWVLHHPGTHVASSIRRRNVDICPYIQGSLSHRLIAVVWVPGILIYTWYLHLQRSFPIERLAAQHRYRKIALTAKDEARCLVCAQTKKKVRAGECSAPRIRVYIPSNCISVPEKESCPCRE